MTHSAWWLVVDALAVYRLTLLVVRDTITARAREALVGRVELSEGLTIARRVWLAEFITCPWCVSIWLGAGVVALTRFVPGVWQYPGMGLALSAVAGYLAER